MAVALPLSLYGCAGDKGAKREPLIVGGLPVTCNLTLPVACTAKAASIKAGTATNDFEFEYSKYSGWPEIKELLMSNRTSRYFHGALVMDPPTRKIPEDRVAGHRPAR